MSCPFPPKDLGDNKKNGGQLFFVVPRDFRPKSGKPLTPSNGVLSQNDANLSRLEDLCLAQGCVFETATAWVPNLIPESDVSTKAVSDHRPNIGRVPG
jgi:hypothetical protein